MSYKNFRLSFLLWMGQIFLTFKTLTKNIGTSFDLLH